MRNATIHFNLNFIGGHIMKGLAVITGASRGMGEEIAKYFAEKNYDLILLATNKGLLKQVRSECLLINATLNVDTCSIDISRMKNVYDSIKQLISKKKTIDVLVNCAGIAPGGTSSMDIDTFENLQAVNVNGTFAITKAVAEKMKSQRSGYIINIGSMSGKRARATFGGYAASKFAMLGLNQALFKELLEYNIKVTAINPGMTNTDMTSGSSIENADKIQKSDIVKTIDFLLSLGGTAVIEGVDVKCKEQTIRQEV